MTGKKMTSRERVRAVINHKEADKIPVDCGGMRSTGLLGKTYNDLKKYMGINVGETKIYDMVQQLTIPEDWYLDKFQIDVVDLARTFADDPHDWVDWKLPDGSDVKIPSWLKVEKRGTSWFVVDEDGDEISEMPEKSYFFDQKIWPLLDKYDIDLNKIPEYLKKIMWTYMKDPLWKNSADPDFYNMVKENAKKLYEQTDYSIMAGFGGQLVELGQYMYRNDEFFIRLLTEKEETEKVLDRLTEIHIAGLEPYLDAVSPYADVIVMGDDLGTQNAPMISPELYKEVFYPRHKKIYQLIKNKTNMKIFFHCCGAMTEFIPDLIDAGVDIINPVQTNAAGMDAEKLKREYGKDLVFWGGGIDTQQTLRVGSIEDVRAEVRKNCNIFMKDGGFVFNQIHNMLPGIPPENIIAMYDEVNKIKY